MGKFALLLHRKSSISRDGFIADYTTVQKIPAIGERGTLHRLHASDALRAEAVGKRPQAARCDGLTFAWRDGEEPAEEILPDSVERCHRYRVDEVVHWDNLPTRHPGQWTPGIKMIAVVRRREGVSTREFRDLYLAHANVAREHHPGVGRYVQNFVVDAVGAPPVDAIAELHFPTVSDLTDHFYRDETSAKIVGADVVRFLAAKESWSVLGEEYVVG